MPAPDKSDFRQEDALQAVVVADSFNVRFAPLTDRRPRTLLPLVNAPMLEYTLQLLCVGGVKEAIVFCCSHADKIKDFLSRSQWSKSTSSMKVTTVVSEGCMSVGDALRDLDNKSILRSDFILVNGDLVGNVSLRPVVEEHRKRRQLSKNVVMTMIFKVAPPKHRSRCKEDDVIISVKSSTQHVVAFQRQRSQKKFHILQEANESAEDIKVHYNLLDCGIYVCSPHMPQLLTDNFDYQTTDDFVRGVLGSEEILGNSIHLHVLKDQYALRASNLYMYHVVSLDVLKRWSYPFVPDSSILELPNGRLVYYSDNVYRHQSVKLTPTCELLENVAVDAGSKIGSKTIISNSTIGASCIIGENVKINGCHIWSGTTIEDNAVITDSILDMNVFVGKGACINSKCILGHGVKIGEGITLQEGTRLVGESLSGLEPLQSGSVAAFFYRMPSSAELEETEDLECAVWDKHFGDDEDEEDDDDDDDDNSAGGELDDDEASEAKTFEEMLINLDRALDEEVSAQNVILEMNSIKHAYGIQIQSLTTMLIKAILELPFRRLGSRQIEAKKYVDICVPFVKKFLPLLQNYIKNLLSEQMALSALEQFAFENSVIVSALPKVAQTLYSMDVLSEDGILAWWKSKERLHGETLRIAMKSFIEWLENAEEESD